MGSRGFKENLFRYNDEFANCYGEETRNKFFVVENEDNISVIKGCTLDDEPALKVTNPKPLIGFLKFDNCYARRLKEYSGTRCDCLLFTSKELLFVELKLNTESRKKITDNLKEGRIQLSNTISYFYEHFKDDFMSLSNNAIVVLSKLPYPRNTARLANLKKEFLVNNHGVEYFENSEFNFKK